MNLIVRKHLQLLLATILALSIGSNVNRVFGGEKPEFISKFPTESELFSKVEGARSTVDSVGKRIVIFWRPSGITAFEELVIHQAPSTHLTELLTPTDRERSRRRDRSDGKSEKRRGNREGLRPMRRIGPPPPDFIEPQFLSKSYKVEIAPGEQIAGQNTYLVTISPKVAERPRKKLWFDAQHYITLRMEHYDIMGKLAGISVYTTICYDSMAVTQQLEQYQNRNRSQEQMEGKPHREELSLAEAEKTFGERLPQPSYLPIGFQLRSISMMDFRDNLSVHFRYTDGLVQLSLFVSKSNERDDRPHRRLQDDRRSNKKRTVVVKGIPIAVIDPGHVRILDWKTSREYNLRLVMISGLSLKEMVKVAESLID